MHSETDGDDLSRTHLKQILDLAVVALRNLGGGVRLAKRCSRYLEALSKVAASLSKLRKALGRKQNGSLLTIS